MTSSPALRTRTNAKALRGAEKAAALLLYMGKPLASRLLTHFDAGELKQITRSIADLGTVPVPALEQLVEEFASKFADGADLLGSADEVQQMLDGVLPPEQIADVMSDVTGNSNHAVWDRLSQVPEAVLAGYLAKEHPQTAAFMRRMLSIAPVTESAMRLIQSQLQEDLLSNVSRQTGSGQHARLADIINKLQHHEMDDVMQNLAAERPKEAEILRKLMFTFDDIIKRNPRGRTVLFDKIPTELIVLALKGTDSSFRDAILASLAARARRIVETELTSGGSASQRDVLKARRTIADAALELASGGEIELSSFEDEDELFD
jgi:flagellar motor switch protein FliG